MRFISLFVAVLPLPFIASLPSRPAWRVFSDNNSPTVLGNVDKKTDVLVGEHFYGEKARRHANDEKADGPRACGREGRTAGEIWGGAASLFVEGTRIRDEICPRGGWCGNNDARPRLKERAALVPQRACLASFS